MRKATGIVTGKYDYNYTCPMCDRVIKWTDAKLRWDNKWVCKEDWEPRHPMDFYRTKNDAHILTQTNNDQQAVWSPVVTNNDTAGAETAIGSYNTDSINNLLNFNIVLKRTIADLLTATSYSITLPTTSVAAGTYRVTTEHGALVRTGTIGAVASTFTLSAINVRDQGVVITGQYGT